MLSTKILTFKILNVKNIEMHIDFNFQNNNDHRYRKSLSGTN